MTIGALIVLVFALCFALFEAYKGSAGIRPANFGWMALALLIIADLFFHGAGLFNK
jgi:hypothetical protein